MIQTRGVDPNPTVTHSSLRKASLDIHWCVLDLVISGANCHVGKFRCRCAVVLLKKRRTWTNTNTQWHSQADTHTHTLIILRSQLRGGAADLERGNMNDYSFLQIPRSCNKAFIHLVSDILKRTNIWPWTFYKRGQLGLSLKARSITRFLYCY